MAEFDSRNTKNTVGTDGAELKFPHLNSIRSAASEIAASGVAYAASVGNDVKRYSEMVSEYLGGRLDTISEQLHFPPPPEPSSEPNRPSAEVRAEDESLRKMEEMLVRELKAAEIDSLGNPPFRSAEAWRMRASEIGLSMSDAGFGASRIKRGENEKLSESDAKFLKMVAEAKQEQEEEDRRTK